MAITKADSLLCPEPYHTAEIDRRVARAWTRALAAYCRGVLERSAFRGSMLSWWADRQIRTHGLRLLSRSPAITASELAAVLARRFGFDESDPGVMYALRLRCVDVLKACERRGLLCFAQGDKRERVTRRWSLNRNHPDVIRMRGAR